MNDNSLYGARYGIACKTQDLIAVLPSYKKCATDIKTGTIDNTLTCQNCLRWGLIPSTKL